MKIEQHAKLFVESEGSVRFLAREADIDSEEETILKEARTGESWKGWRLRFEIALEDFLSFKLMRTKSQLFERGVRVIREDRIKRLIYGLSTSVFRYK